MDASNPAAAPAAQQKPQTQKSFTERFVEMEQLVQNMQFVLQFHTSVIKEFIPQLSQLTENQNIQRDTLNAILKLSDDGVSITTANIINKIANIEAENYRALLKGNEDSGKLVRIDSVSDEEVLVAYTSPDVAYGYNKVKAFQDEAVKKDFIGKKIGDTVGEFTIEGLYVEASQTGEQNGQKQNSPQQ